MADDVFQASEIAFGIAITITTWRDADAGVLPDVIESLKGDAERLADLLEPPAGGDELSAGDQLSLANPYPVSVAGHAWESHASAVAIIVLRNPKLAEQFDSFTWMGVAKEYERATKKPFNADDTNDEINAICARYTPPPCPKCGSARGVTSTRSTFRYVRCDTCKESKKVSNGTAKVL